MSKELGTLVVVVLKAQHLIDNHTFYKQDPYAKLSLSGATKQTPPDPKGGQHPVWDAELRFPISKDASKNNRTLTISVFSEEKKDDELLGEGSVDITDTLKSGEFDGVPPFSLFIAMGSLTLRIDWVPLSLKGTQRGEVYLEMTFFASGPAPLTRRPTKFTSPSERLGRPQQPITQHPQRVTSQPPSSSISPQGQQGSRLNAQEAPRPGPLEASRPGFLAHGQDPQPNTKNYRRYRRIQSLRKSLSLRSSVQAGLRAQAIQARMDISPNPIPVIRTHYLLFLDHPHRRAISLPRRRHLRHSRHTRNGSRHIRARGLRDTAGTRQVDIQLRSLLLMHSPSPFMFTIRFHRNHHRLCGNKPSIRRANQLPPTLRLTHRTIILLLRYKRLIPPHHLCHHMSRPRALHHLLSLMCLPLVPPRPLTHISLAQAMSLLTNHMPRL
jgi:hypothetical protein